MISQEERKKKEAKDKATLRCQTVQSMLLSIIPSILVFILVDNELKLKQISLANNPGVLKLPEELSDLEPFFGTCEGKAIVSQGVELVMKRVAQIRSKSSKNP